MGDGEVGAALGCAVTHAVVVVERQRSLFLTNLSIKFDF